MTSELFQFRLLSERDVVTARQQARAAAEALGFDHHTQIRIATAVSEIARNAFRYARGGSVLFRVDPAARDFEVVVSDAGGGIPHLEDVLAGAYRSPTGMGMGITGTRRLMDSFDIETSTAGTTVTFAKLLPPGGPLWDAPALEKLAARLARPQTASAVAELETQNRELLKTLNELRERREELLELNAELEDTNRGVVALYAELDERADYLRRASELKSSFLSHMSHEFRTPLNSMLALSRMLLDRMDGDLTPEQEQQIRFIERSARELADMVDDLLDLAKVEAGRLEARSRSFSVDDLFGALRGMLRPLIAASTLNLVFDDAAALPMLFTDEQKVAQILRNFISNAIKFTPAGEVRVTASAEGTTMRFTVADTGIGIAPGDLGLIFEEFGQVDSGLSRQVKGTGLGLPLTRKLAALLGGTVAVTSTPGVGSTFTLTLPIVYDADAPAEPVAGPAPTAGARLVLVVEDNQETAFVYTRYLEEAGFVVHCVASVQAAERALERTEPAAVLLDVNLRGETTWDLLRTLKQRAAAPPVLVVSVADESEQARRHGADGFLRKPFSPDALVAWLARATSLTGRPRILLIDDNEVSRYLLRGHLPEADYEVHEARDGREGVRMAATLDPALIFLDFYMPGLTGAEVLRDLRALPGLASTPIVLHSTKLLERAEAEFFREHGVVVFPKQMLSQPEAAGSVRALLDALAVAQPGAALQATAIAAEGQHG